MDLSTDYLGLSLPHPFTTGASPLVSDVAAARRLEDAGCAALVLHSLFEEQLTHEEVETVHHLDAPGEAYGEALTYLPNPPAFKIGPDEYLDLVGDVKEAVGCPVIASLNGTTPAGWLRYAALIQQAGADALELNIYDVVTDAGRSADEVESDTVDMVHEIRKSVHIPVAVKLSPFYTSLANFAVRLEARGATGFVLFNRIFQPEIDVDDLEIKRALTLSQPSELWMRLRWLAILRERVQSSLAATGGVHGVEDCVKALMCGADVVQLVSAVMRKGAERVSELIAELRYWLEEHEYESLAQLRGSMSIGRCPDPRAYERANYVETLQSWRS